MWSAGKFIVPLSGEKWTLLISRGKEIPSWGNPHFHGNTYLLTQAARRDYGVEVV